MSLYPKDKNPVFQPGGYGLRYDGQAEAIARAGEPPINYAPGQELSRAAPALPEHPTLGVPEISERGEDGYWTISAGGCAWIKARVSLGEGVRLWNELVNCARYPDAPVLTRGMLE